MACSCGGNPNVLTAKGDKHMHKFDADFYITASTVIPVLYLALTLQGRLYESTLTRWRAAADVPWPSPSYTSWPAIRFLAVGVAAITIAFVCVLGVYAEYLSIKALYYQKSFPGSQSLIFQLIIALLVVAVAGPFFAFWAAYFDVGMRMSSRAEKRAGEEE
jgi:hypothetical protein